MENSIFPRRLLLVHCDQQGQQRIIDRLCSRYPHLLVTAVSDSAGLRQAVDQNLFDLVLVGSSLKTLSGLQILSILRIHLSGAPVILCASAIRQWTAALRVASELDTYVLLGSCRSADVCQLVADIWQSPPPQPLGRTLEPLLDRLAVGAFRLAPAGEVVEVNNGLMRLLQTGSPRQARQLLQQQGQLQDFAQRSDYQELEVPIRTGEGTTRWLRLQTIGDSQATAPFVDGLAIDITPQKHTEARLVRRIRQLQHQAHQYAVALEHLKQQLEKFSFFVAHDLRAPIRRISDFATLLESQLTDADATVRKYLSRIKIATYQASQLISNLLEYSRIGYAPLTLTQVDMGGLVSSVRGQVEAPDQQPPIRWQIRSLPQVTGDGVLLRRVWQNLLENAIKFTQTRQQIELSIYSYAADNTVVFAVKDNGIGFQPEEHRRIFELFQRLHSSQEFEGTGIGLANVKRIVQRHGGQVWAEGQPEQGATFFFSLPTSSRRTEAAAKM